MSLTRRPRPKTAGNGRLLMVSVLGLATAIGSVWPAQGAGASSQKANHREPASRSHVAGHHAGRKPLATGSISGKVTDNSSHNLSGICVEATGPGSGFAESATDGTYIMSGLTAGSYTVEFMPGCGSVSVNWIDQWWNDASTQASATKVTVTSGGTASGINAAMQPGGMITGTVTDNKGNALLGICIDATTTGGASGFAESAADGTYAISPLLSGSYIVSFQAGCGSVSQNWLPQWWKNAGSSETATPVSVVEGSTSTGIDAAMQPGGTIEGKVTSSGSTGVPNICVSVTGPMISEGTTASGGTYAIAGLIPGAYTVEFSDCEDTGNFMPQWWKNSATASGATPVTLTAGQTVTAISAALQVGGSISGKVTTNTGTALPGICVEAGSGQFFAESASDGTYTLKGLATNSYVVEFVNCGTGNWLNQYWKDATSVSDATPVAVTQGKNTAGINASMQPGGSVSGKVTTNTGTALASVCVEATLPGSFSIGGETETGPTGTYTMTGLVPGSYDVQFDPSCLPSANWLPQWWKNASTQALATPVTVTAGKTTSGINAALQPGGVISGVVMDNASHPLAGICVDIVDTSGFVTTLFATSAADGSYSIKSLPTGTYLVEFSPGCSPTALNWLKQYWKGSGVADLATPVSVTAGKTTSGVSPTMEPGGTITGNVKGNTNANLDGICVDVQPISPVGSGGSAITGSSGNFSVVGLATGNYAVLYYAGSDCGSVSDNWLSQYRAGASTLSAARSVAVIAGKSTTGVNAVLEPGGEITGTVTGPAPSTAALGGVCVDAVSPDGNVQSSGLTDSSGTYTLPALTSGSYYVNFDNCGSSSVAPQWYKGTATESSGTAVAVVAGKTTSGIDAQMATGGQVTGTVTVSGGGAAVGACVEAAPIVPGFELTGAQVAADGTYDIQGLPSGKFIVRFDPSCSQERDSLGQFYKAASAPSTSTQISVTQGKTTAGVNATLAVAGEITGTVKTTGGTPVGYICVDASSTGTASGASGITGSDGTYTLQGLTTGKYTVEFFDCGGVSSRFSIQWYNDQSSGSKATPVTVTAGKVTPNINASLSAGGQISGTVTRPGGVGEAGVCIFAGSTAGGGGGGFTTTGGGGTYTLFGVVPGTYVVQFEPDCVGTDFAEQWYKGALLESKATLVTVTAGKTTTGVNALLAASGEISGVVKAGSSPMASVCVSAFLAGSETVIANSESGAGGAFELLGLPAGSYDVFFDSCSGAGNWAPLWWQSSTSQSGAKAVAVTAGKDTAGIDPNLTVGGSISGTVKTLSGLPIPGVEVFAYPKGSGSPVGFAFSGTKGAYTIVGLPAGSYDVEFGNSGCDRGWIYAAQWWKTATSQSAATSVSVTVGHATTGINSAVVLASLAC